MNPVAATARKEEEGRVIEDAYPECRYTITRHKFFDGGHGHYVEILEVVENRPVNRCGFITHHRLNEKGCFFEWETLEAAIDSFTQHAGKIDLDQLLCKSAGFVYQSDWEESRPWFLAEGNEFLNGDFVEEA